VCGPPFMKLCYTNSEGASENCEDRRSVANLPLAPRMRGKSLGCAGRGPGWAMPGKIAPDDGRLALGAGSCNQISGLRLKFLQHDRSRLGCQEGL